VPDVLALIGAGKRRIVVQSPTGMGKTVMMQDLALDYLNRKLTAILYTNRRLLIDQTSRVMDAAGIPHGVISPEHDDQANRPFQIAMAQTVFSRVFKLKRQKMHDADLVLVDEAHLQTGDTTKEILDAHANAGAAIVGFTATPIDLEDTYDHLLVEGTPSEGRACGALLLARHYAPDEPDWAEFNRKKKGKKIGEECQAISEREAKSAIMRPEVFGRVLAAYKELNPEQKPTILFGPDLAGSMYFAEQFTLAGIPAAHIDGENVWAAGKLYSSGRTQRESVIGAVRDGRCKVVCNRFVLREGLDIPEIGHCILATLFGSLSSYLQSVGRALRFCRGYDSVTIQDHGGHWWRFGSPNIDRRWVLGATNTMMLGLHADRLRATRSEGKPRPCPQCKGVQVWKGPVCQFCGWTAKAGQKWSRPVVQMDGTLREMVGDVFRPHRTYAQANGPALWKRMYFRSLQPKAKGRTFRAAAALFAQENHWSWPDRRWPLMPRTELDFYRSVRDVPQDELIQEEEWQTA
jgi:superfamily II DNA or RNA helicase